MVRIHRQVGQGELDRPAELVFYSCEGNDFNLARCGQKNVVIFTDLHDDAKITGGLCAGDLESA